MMQAIKTAATSTDVGVTTVKKATIESVKEGCPDELLSINATMHKVDLYKLVEFNDPREKAFFRLTITLAAFLMSTILVILLSKVAKLVDIVLPTAESEHYTSVPYEGQNPTSGTPQDKTGLLHWLSSASINMSLMKFLNLTSQLFNCLQV
jgi:hypothetical protein